MLVFYFLILKCFNEHGILLPQFYIWGNWGQTTELKFQLNQLVNDKADT